MASRLNLEDHWWAVFDSKLLWSGRLDGSLANIFGDIQLAAASVVLLTLGLRRPRSPVYAGWGALFLTATAADLLPVDHLFTPIIVSAFAVTEPATPTQTVATAILWAVAGIALGTCIVVAHVWSCPEARIASWRLAGAALLLGFFAGVVDLVSKAAHATGAYAVIAYIETAGELMSVSFILVVTLERALGYQRSRQVPGRAR